MDPRLAHFEPQPELVLQQQQLLAVQEEAAGVATDTLQEVEQFQTRARLEQNQDGERLQCLQTSLEEQSGVHERRVADEFSQIQETATGKAGRHSHFWFRWRSAAVIVMEGVSCDMSVSGPSSSAAWGTKGFLDTMAG